MATSMRTADRRVGFVVAAAFFAGVAFAIVVAGPSAWEPAPESSFRIDDAAVEAERPPVAVVDDLPQDAVRLAVKPSAAAVSPERLALADAPAPIAEAIAAQALPASADETDARENPPNVPAPPAAEPVEPAPLAPDLKPIAAISRPVPDQSPELIALVDRLRSAEPSPGGFPSGESLPPPPARLPAAATATAADAAPPLPGEAWTDPDGVNWSDSPVADSEMATPPPPRSGRILGRLMERRGEPERPGVGGQPLGPRLFDRVRDRIAQRISESVATDAGPSATEPHLPTDGSCWPATPALDAQFEPLRGDAVAESISAWAAAAVRSLTTVRATGGPRDPAAEPLLLELGDRVAEGMRASDTVSDAAMASRTRRAALAIARRVAVWRAAAACCAEITGPVGRGAAGEIGPGVSAAGSAAEIAVLLEALERFESSHEPADATRVRDATRRLAAAPLAGAAALQRAVHDHYLTPNVRISVSEQFVEKLLPETTVTTSPLHDYVLGRQVRGTKTVEQTTAVRFTPHPSEIRLSLLVSGQIASRTVTDAGSVAIHSRGQSSFTVFKPIQVSPRGLGFEAARGTASNQSQLAGIETDFDGVPLMGSLMRGIARNQHDENLDQATREVNAKIVGRACREVDQQTEPQLAAAAKRIGDRFWTPLVRLGLDPAAVALETTETAATARLRIAAPTQLAAHTPRPRAPEDALFSIQVHESTVNNACDRFGLAGRTMSLEELTAHVCGQLGLPPQVPDDPPEGVEVTFAESDPVRVECRDGLVHVRITLDALRSGRRNNWYEIVARVAYRPTAAGLQVMLERDGPVQLSGPGQKGRMEFALRTIFGKMFPKERPVRLVPDSLLANPRFAGVQAVQAITADGWLAIALAPTTATAPGRTSATAGRPNEFPQRLLRR
ncbi:MAG: hypothetical protein ACKO4T_04890 [Planctomycetaceae bacterium]